MLLTRILTAAVLLGGFAATLIFLDRPAFVFAVGGVVALGAYEWAGLAGQGRLSALAYAAACVLAFGLFQGGAFVMHVLWVATAFWVVGVPWWLASSIAIKRKVLLLTGFVVLIPAGLAMAALPPRYLLMALGLVWIADSAAYFTGRAFGKRKLAPKISPGKTWEGVAGGAIGCIFYAIIWATFDPQLRARVEGEIWMPFLGATLLLCALGVLGDLLESALKRQAGAKDSGRLLPGHGGVLDRIDSATATLPAAMLLITAMGIA